jgi:predicted Zn-dependent protease
LIINNYLNTKKEAALQLLKNLVQESSADQTEAILLTEDSSLTRFAGSAVHQHVAERNQTVILRAVLGKKIAVVTTNIFQPSSLKKSLREAITLAKVQQPNDEFISLPGPKPIPEVETSSKNIGRLTPNQKVRMTKNLLKQVKERGCRASGAFFERGG